jgi:hypothetical protein
MNKDLKSFLTSLGFILIYFSATSGIVKLLWNTKNDNLFTLRVGALVNLSFVLSLIYIVGIYHLVGPYHVTVFYKLFLAGQLIYIGVGLISDSLIKR